MTINIIQILLVCALILWIGYFLITIRNKKKMPKLGNLPKIPFKSLPLVSVIIPTRNESHRIKKCIESLKLQDYPKLEIIIVDDSTDDTIQIIEKTIGNDKRFRIIEEKKLPKGWIGKTHALQQGSVNCRGKYLLFLDADTYHEPDLIMTAISYTKHKKLDFLTIMPKNICRSFWEKVIQPIPLGFLTISFNMANNPKSKVAMAFGPFILIKRSAYNKVGGYKKIKNKIVDDVEMARLIKNAGFKTSLVQSQNKLKVRMYSRFRDIWIGWRKNLILGTVQNSRIKSKILKSISISLGFFVLFEIYVFPFIVVVSTLLSGITNNIYYWDLLLFSSFILIMGFFIQFYINEFYSIGDPKYAPFTVFGGMIILGILINSSINLISGKGVTWKGRAYCKNKSQNKKLVWFIDKNIKITKKTQA